jgi:hypothetical protein
MSEIKPTECTVCEPWGFSAESDKARARCCPACAGTGLVYALPDTHRIVSVEFLEEICEMLEKSLVWTARNSISAIIEEKVGS